MRQDAPRQAAIIDAWMQKLARAPLPAPSRASSAVLLWKARVQRGWDIRRGAGRRLERAADIPTAVCGIAAVVVAAWAWVAAPASRPLLIVAGVVFVATLAITAPRGLMSRFRNWR